MTLRLHHPRPPQLRTLGTIAGELGVPQHRIVYVLKTRPHLMESARAGHVRLFDRDTAEAIARELAAIDDRRRQGRGEA